MISHSSIAPTVSTNNNTDYPYINSLKPINYLNLPIEAHHEILSFCSVNTLLSLRKTARKFYNIITPEIMRSRIYQENIPKHSTLYSIPCYENFIAPILNHLNPQSKKNISKYLAHAKNKNSSFKKGSHFIGGEIVMMNHQFKKNILTSKNINLERSDFDLFAMSKLSNNCVFSTRNGEIFLYSFSANNTLKKVDQFYKNEQQVKLTQLEFSPKNNLFVVTSDGMMLLWKLNLNADPLIKNEILWELNVFRTNHEIRIFNNEQQLIGYAFGRISIWTLNDQHQLASRQYIEDFLHIKDHSNTLNTVLSSNNNCIALVSSYLTDGASDVGFMRLFSRANNQSQFSEDSIATDIDNFCYIESSYKFNPCLQLNAKGNICVYIANHYSLILLNKCNNIWNHILYLDKDTYSNVELSPYDTHIYCVKSLDNQRVFNTISLKNISLNSITSDNDKKQINNFKSKYHNENHYFVDNNINNLTITYKSHPTGLAIALFNSSAQTLKLYYPKK